MFRSKTLFILGAGSSQEVGLPVGNQLKEIIAKNIKIEFADGYHQSSGSTHITNALNQISSQRNGGFPNINPYLEKLCTLINALPLAISIDNLLDAHKEDEKISVCGKLGIVSSILEAERKSSLFFNVYKNNCFNIGQSNNTWFSELLKLLTENVSKSEISNIFTNVDFINFNYDRCLEHYLFHTIQTYYNLSRIEIFNVINKLKVFRPYGVVGKLDWQDNNLQSVPYGSDNADLSNLYRGIKTFNEQIHDESVISSIKKLIEEAETIVFLGFAYHRQNTELLRIVERSQVKRILGTAFGLSNSDCIEIKNELISTFALHRSSLIELKQDLKCKDLLIQYGRTLTA